MEFTLLIIMQQKHLKQIFLKLCSILKMRLYVYIAFPPRSIGGHWWPTNNLLWLFFTTLYLEKCIQPGQRKPEFLAQAGLCSSSARSQGSFLDKGQQYQGDLERDNGEREEKKSFYLLTSGILAQVLCRRPYNLFQPCSLYPARTQALSLMKKKFIKYKQSLIKTIIAKSHEWQFIIQSSK